MTEENETLIPTPDATECRQIETLWRKRFYRLCLAFVIFAVVCIAGFLGLYFFKGDLAQPSKQTERDPQSFHKNILLQMKTENIEKNLRELTDIQHIAGSLDDENQSRNVIYKKWKSFLGEGNVQLKKYEVLLSYPVTPGNVSIYDEKKKEIIFTSHPYEKPVWPDENITNVRAPLVAYSPSGNVKGKLVYVNYARPEDFQKLADLNISCEGKILIGRDGKIFGPNMIALAEKAGAVGLVLFLDPSAYAQGKTTYPNSWWLPPDGVMRGTAKNIDIGDPLTPSYPSTNGTYRIPEKDAKFAKIPVLRISYRDALPLMRQLDGIQVPDNWTDWHGGLNTSYGLTMDSNNINKIVLKVNNKNEKKYIYNIIATIQGQEEPDRLVLFGNHHDAWVMGAVDPDSGTAVLMEIARVFGQAYNTGWRPRRTVMLCSWDAEEYGLIGSYEWVEEYGHMLSSQAVAYINVDMAVTGNYSLRVKSSEQLANIVFQAAKKVTHPGNNTLTVYQNWEKSLPDSFNPGYPRISMAGSGSDFQPFYTRYGIPVMDLRYTFDRNAFGELPMYPVYHTIHDSFHFMKKFVDPKFTYHLALGRIWAQVGLTLADSVILSFNFTRLAWRLNLCVENVENAYKEKLAYNIISLDRLKHRVKKFMEMSKIFDESVAKLGSEESDLKVRIANDQMMQVERAFIAPEGLPDRPQVRNVIFATAGHNSYAGSCFTGFVGSLSDATKNNTSSWTKVKKQLSIVEYYIQQATRSMEPLWN